MSKKPVDIVEEPEADDEGEESDEYDVEEEGDDGDYVDEGDEEEDVNAAGPSGEGSLTALLLGSEGDGEEDDEEEEQDDEEYNEGNGVASHPPSVSGIKRSREDDTEAEVRAGTTAGGDLKGDYGEVDELDGVVAASATKKARTASNDV